METLYQPVAVSNTLIYQPLSTLVYFIPENIQLYSCLLNHQLAWGLGFMFLKSINKEKSKCALYKMPST